MVCSAVMAAIDPPTSKNLADYSTLLASLASTATLLSQGAHNWSTLGDLVAKSSIPAPAVVPTTVADALTLVVELVSKEGTKFVPTQDWLTAVAAQFKAALPAQTAFEVTTLTAIGTLFEQWAAELSASVPSTSIVNINAGGGATTDADGTIWAADEFETGGTTQDWTGTPTVTIVGDSAIYNSERAGIGIAGGNGFQYAITVPSAGPYVLGLRFVEHYVPAQAPNVRRTDVYLGDRSTGTKIINGLDTFECANTAFGAGANHALLIERNVIADSTTLHLDFVAAAASTVACGSLAGISIRSGADALADPAPLNDGSSAAVLSGLRTLSQWPYDRFSPCNTPIGSNANYQPSGITAPSNLNGSAKAYPDTVEVVMAVSGDASATVSNPFSFGDRDGGPIVVNGTLPHFPQSYLVPDATSGSTPNEQADIIDADGVTVRRIFAMCHTAPGIQLYGYNYGSFQIGQITDQFPHGGHASLLNGMGHALRAADFSGPTIQHALGLELCGPRNYKYGGSLATSYVWPAAQCDAYAGTAWTAAGNGSSPNGTHYATTYGALNPSLPSYMMIGALLAIHPSKVYADYAVTTDLGKKIFDALQNYGGYALDDSGGYDYWNSSNITVRADAYTALNAAGGLTQAVRDEIARMIGGLMVIVNNTPTSIGGGGAPRVPLAPDHT